MDNEKVILIKSVCRFEEITLREFVLVQVRISVKGLSVSKKRSDDGFNEMVKKCMQFMLEDNLKLFKRFLKSIKNTDYEYFKMGKSLLDEKVAMYRLE